MKNHPRDWIAWMVAVAIVVVAAVELMSNASAAHPSRAAETGWLTPPIERV
jgi:hypothetical protein